MSKRNDYLSWKETFMNIAQNIALRSKDPNTQVGSLIVNNDNIIIGTGYNGFPRGISDDHFSWDKPEKYNYVIHAEINAIINSNDFKSIKNSTLYTTLFPCKECSKIIIQLGIKNIIYLSDKYNNTEDNLIAKKMLDYANITYTKY